ncbi:GNAT family N-acetyltransferase [Lactococcus ileimucosae]|uniref:GNAT family N-acetyltransferase n=1 Tax=Lactococcus ileimucosae TaxID=2941329 RepID=UPI003516F62D
MEKKQHELLDLATYAFNKPRSKAREEAFEKLLSFSKSYSYWENDKLSSMIIDTSFRVYWKEDKLKMSGIGYVASYPEFRGNGSIRKLMTDILEDNYEAGTALSYLAPFSYQFYGQFGYHYAFDQKAYTVPAQEFPKGKKTVGQVQRRAVSEELFEDMAEVHDHVYNQGSLVRPKHVWEYYFEYKSQPYFATYEENGRVLGYLIYEFAGTAFIIRECITLTQEAKAALYRFVSSHAASFEVIKWTAPSNVFLEYDLAEPSRTQLHLQPYMQARIVNLQAFLKVNGQPTFSARIVDDILPQNNICVGPETDDPEEMTIGAFTARVLRENNAILREYF